MSFGIYLAGYVIMIIGLGLGAHYMHIPPHWIAVGVVVMIGLGILSGVSKTRTRDQS
jgi:uncharacterized membrane protein